MAARELLLVAFAGAIIRGALFAWPPNVTYFIDEESCRLRVTWDAMTVTDVGCSDCKDCTQKYIFAAYTSGTWINNSECIGVTSWDKLVPLGEEIDFKVKTSCHIDCMDPSDLNDEEAFHVVQNGAVGTGARDISCTWWNRKYMDCSWRAGEKASHDTSYKLFYWHDDLEKGHQCRNFTSNGSVFQCSFEWNVVHVPVIAISILGNSGNIRPSCRLFYSINSLVKLDPPVITNVTRLSTKDSDVFLQWTKPDGFYDLKYEVKVDSEQKPKSILNTGSATITADPAKRHTFRVRVRSGNGHWSDWSNEVALECKTSTVLFLLFILIPFCVALLLVILLIYLKRIKLLILPKIPDPELILNHMFEEHNENPPICETANDEDTHLLKIVEPAGNEK